MTKRITFVFLLMTSVTVNATAAFMDNVSEGIFEFRLDHRAPNYVTYTKISLAFSNFSRTKGLVLIEDQTISYIGQYFTVTSEDDEFPEAIEFLTNGLSDYIAVMVANDPAFEVIESTEPDLLYGDPSGDKGIDFFGRVIESIKLEITDMFFIHGFDPNRGPYTNISVQGEVTVNAESDQIAKLARAYGAISSDDNYSSSMDTDDDGDVDGEDLIKHIKKY